MRRQGLSQNAGVVVVLVGTVLGNFAVSTLLFISLPFLPQVASSRGQFTWMPGVWPTSCLAQLTRAWEPRLPREHTMTVSWPPAGVCWTSRLATATALCPTMTSCMQPAIWREHLLQGKLFFFFFTHWPMAFQCCHCPLDNEIPKGHWAAVKKFNQLDSWVSLSGVPDYFDRNKILSGYDLSHYQVPHCIKSFLLFCLICVYSSQFSILF